MRQPRFARSQVPRQPSVIPQRCAGMRGCLGFAAGFSALLWLPCALQAAYLESGEDGPQRDVQAPAPAPIRRRPPAPSPHENPLAQVIGRLRVERPYTYENLTVFPLSLRGPIVGLLRRRGTPDVRTLDEAIRRDWITVYEKGHAEVPRVTVRNRSQYRVFLMNGEILVGGKQNRVVRDDVLLPPHSPAIEIPVYCVEKGRWAGTAEHFRPAPILAHPALRRRAASGASQDSIWREVESQSERLGVHTANGDYGKVYDDAGVRAQLDRIMPRLRRVPRSGHVGVVVAAGNRILGADIFTSNRLFTELWEKICRSYLLDYVARHPWHSQSIDRHDAQRFLEAALAARARVHDTPGVGHLWRLDGAAEGTVLSWRGDVLHASLYGGHQIQPLPGPRPR